MKFQTLHHCRCKLAYSILSLRVIRTGGTQNKSTMQSGQSQCLGHGIRAVLTISRAKDRNVEKLCQQAHTLRALVRVDGPDQNEFTASMRHVGQHSEKIHAHLAVRGPLARGSLRAESMSAVGSVCSEESAK